jgi:3-deoxy-7-phosphoheptulonate synthase
MSMASVACGADGIIVEVHRNPPEALSDKDQALTPPQFADMAKKVRALRAYMDGNGK